MYSTCLFCNQSLCSNEVVEAFPVGRRLAFDQRRGRLWVVCRKCEKWNLTPLEERWEAIESCERLFRDTRKRVSTDNIGLARLAEGLELVRIGDPQRPEFAAWRYGDQFGRRRRRANVFGGVLLAAGISSAAAIIGGNMFLGGGVVVTVGTLLNNALTLRFWVERTYHNRKILGEVPSTDGTQWLVRGRYLWAMRLIPSASGDGWGLEVPCEANGIKQRVVIEGPNARRLAAKLVPRLTPDGGNRDQVRRGVNQIEERGDPEKYLNWLARNPRRVRDFMRGKDVVTGQRRSPGESQDTLILQGIDALLAAEMAVNEENERRALEGELALLDEAWKDAEEIAAIADGLALPRSVEHGLLDLQGKRSKSP